MIQPGHDAGPEPAEDPRPWQRPGAVRRDCAPHRGPLVVWLGVLSMACGLLTFCAWFPGIFGLALAAVAVLLGERDLAAMREGRMDPTGRPQTEAGLSWASMGALLNSFALLASIGWAIMLWSVLGRILGAPLGAVDK